MTDIGTVILENGQVFQGISVGVPGLSVGEIVFNTALTGYQEVMTDPSYFGQIVLLTAPHIGNTGVNKEDEESSKIYASGFIFNQCSTHYSSWRAEASLNDYLVSHQKVAVSEIDTRTLTQIIRDKGAMKAAIVSGEYDYEVVMEQIKAFEKSLHENMAEQVSISSPKQLNSSYRIKYQVVAYDFGVKSNILKLLEKLGCQVELVPASTPAKVVLNKAPDGVFFSNGPGDPGACQKIIEEIKQIIHADIPLFGICLGYQLLALALGASRIKMKFGHHGVNHPVYDLETHRVLITSQNHNYAIHEQSLGECLMPTHRSLFDQTLQGFCHVSKPIFGFQGHPEASPGPQDAEPLFAPFILAMKERSKDKAINKSSLELINAGTEREDYAKTS